MSEWHSQHTHQYRDDYADLSQGLARLGLSEEGIARALSVPVYAVYEWMEAKPEFAAAVEQDRYEVVQQEIDRRDDLRSLNSTLSAMNRSYSWWSDNGSWIVIVAVLTVFAIIVFATA
jgi:hypothetical protein